MPRFNQQQAKHVAKLANIPLSEQEEIKIAQDFDQTLKVIDNLKELDTNQVEPTHQVTGLENVTREDEVNEKQMFSQKEALANAPKAHQGFFVVPRVLDNAK